MTYLILPVKMHAIYLTGKCWPITPEVLSTSGNETQFLVGRRITVIDLSRVRQVRFHMYHTALTSTLDL
jgi:hypothetical protein